MKALLIPLLALMAIQTLSARTWTNVQGQRIEAELVEVVDEDTIKIRLAGTGQIYEYELADLSEADQTYVAEEGARKAESERLAKLEGRRARWTDDHEEALEEAREFGLPIYLFFTGSDWCGYCMRLKENVLEEKEFEKFADGNLVLMEIDFPSGGLRRSLEEQNEALKKEYGVTGFPTVFVVDAEGNRLGRLGGYGGTPVEEYIDELKSMLKKP